MCFECMSANVPCEKLLACDELANLGQYWLSAPQPISVSLQYLKLVNEIFYSTFREHSQWNHRINLKDAVVPLAKLTVNLEVHS